MRKDSMYQVAWQNEHFIVADKPSGFLTTPSRFSNKDTRPCLMRCLSSDLKMRLWATHRLDFEASGLVLFAKSAEAHRAANAWFESRAIKKVYGALTQKQDSISWPRQNESSTWESRLLRGKKRAYEGARGKDSLTVALFKEHSETYGRWILFPKTGRPHQLRYELFKHGFPIVGDVLYGAHGLNENEISLRSFYLSFEKCASAKKFELPKEISIPLRLFDESVVSQEDLRGL